MTRKQLLLILGISIAVGLALGLLGGAISGLPSLKDLRAEKPSLSTSLLDDEGRPFSYLFIEQRTWVPLSQIPKLMQSAVIAVEDERFYSHWGIDIRALARALIKDLLHLRKV